MKIYFYIVMVNRIIIAIGEVLKAIFWIVIFCSIFIPNSLDFWLSK